MEQQKIEYLPSYLEFFKASKEKILFSWISFETVRTIFDRHGINTLTFLERFATGVFDYFMNVITGHVKIGECPVMEQFLLFLKDVEISSQELFEICTHFKRSMIDFTYEEGINSKAIFDEISYIFDSNFSAILKFYSDTIYAKEQEIIKNMELLAEYKKAIDESSLVYKVSEERKIIYVNDKLLSLSGYEIDEIIGKPYNYLRYDDAQKEQCETIWQELEKKGLYRGIVQNRKKSGESFYLSVTMLRLFNPHEQANEYIVIAYDVTTLIQARIEAIEASEAKEYFLSNMSHEIRTPLNAILGFVALLLDEEKDATHKKYLEIIAKSGENLLNIINDILDFSKIRSGEFSIEPKEFLLYEEMMSVVELFEAAAKSKAITIQKEISSNMPELLYGDIVRIKQIFSNLLANAIKFTPQMGRIVVEIDFSNEQLSFSVSDNGVGIKKEHLAKIFDAFSQVKESGYSHGGTGLGLSISYQLAKHMDGNIEVESIYGIGSKFSVTIPLKVIKSTLAHEDKKHYLPKFTQMEHDTFCGTALIADDNEANCELMAVMLKKFGLSFDIVHDGLQAVKQFKTKEYDLIFMDEQMPNMDGLEAVAKIRSLEKKEGTRRTPICAVTANVIKGAREYDLKSGFDDFLGKPIDIGELRRVLKRFLKQECSKPILQISKSKSTFQIKGANKELLLEQLELEEAELKMLLELYLKKMNSLLPKLYEAIEKKEYQNIAKLAHNIKGSSANFRFEKIQELSFLMEQAAKSNKKDFAYASIFDTISNAIRAIEII